MADYSGTTRPSDVPEALWQAMIKAGNRYNVPPLILAAVWRGESASTFPNPAVNPEGYGGLFGTTDWSGSTQAQANLAASIFHNALVNTKGNILEANSIYATGSSGEAGTLAQPDLHGHAGLPLGTVPGYGSAGRMVSEPTSTGVTSGSSSLTIAPSRDPARPSAQDASLSWNPFNDLLQAGEAGAGALVGGASTVWDGLTAVSDVPGAIAQGFKVFLWLFQPKHWAMMAEVLVGVILLGLGFYWLGTGGESPPIPLPFGLSRVGKAASRTEAVGELAAAA